MSDIIATGSSGYQGGAIDIATLLQNGVSPRRAEHINGCSSAIIQIETILGPGTTLKGTTTDLGTRLAKLINSDGTLKLTGFTGLTTDRGLLATSPTEFIVVNHTPVGLISPYAGNSAPAHWLMCNGAAVSRTVYAKLFAVLGTIYGIGDGSTTFNVPDLRGRIPLGVDGPANRVTAASTGGANADTLGGVGGAETHVLTTNEMPGHTHPEVIPTGVGGTGVYGGGPTGTAGSNTGTTGGGAAHSNTQPWIAINYIIFAQV